MAKHPPNLSDDLPPASYPQTPPPIDLYQTSDIRFVMREMGAFGAKIDRLIEDVGKQSGKISKLETAIDRVKTGMYVAGFILAIVGTIFWWALGDRISLAVKTGLAIPPVTVNSK